MPKAKKIREPCSDCKRKNKSCNHQRRCGTCGVLCYKEEQCDCYKHKYYSPNYLKVPDHENKMP